MPKLISTYGAVGDVTASTFGYLAAGSKSLRVPFLNRSTGVIMNGSYSSHVTSYLPSQKGATFTRVCGPSLDSRPFSCCGTAHREFAALDRDHAVGCAGLGNLCGVIGEFGIGLRALDDLRVNSANQFHDRRNSECRPISSLASSGRCPSGQLAPSEIQRRRVSIDFLSSGPPCLAGGINVSSSLETIVSL